MKMKVENVFVHIQKGKFFHVKSDGIVEVETKTNIKLKGATMELRSEVLAYVEKLINEQGYTLHSRENSFDFLLCKE